MPETQQTSESSPPPSPFLHAWRVDSRISLPPPPPWMIWRETFPLEATPLRPARRPFGPRAIKGMFTPTRSQARMGTITLRSEEITLSGLGIQEVIWAKYVGWIAYSLWLLNVLLSIALDRSLPSNMMVAINIACLGGAVLGGVISGVAATFAELRRIPHEQTIAWEDIVEIQFEQQLRWAIVIYREAKRNGNGFRYRNLTINLKEPSLTATLRETIEHFHPEKISPQPAIGFLTAPLPRQPRRVPTTS